MGNHRDDGEQKKDSFLRTDVDVARNRTAVATDPGMEYGGQLFLSKGEETDGCFQCPKCSDGGQAGTRPNQMRWSNSGMVSLDSERDAEKKRAKVLAELERNGLGRPHSGLNLAHSDKFLSHDAINSHLWQGVGQTPESLKAHRGEAEVYTTVMENKRQKTLHCRSCNRTYRPPEGTYFDVRDPVLFSRFPSQYEGYDKLVNNKSVNPNRSEPMRNSEFRREARNVTFDLKRSTLELKGDRDGDMNEEGEEEMRQGKSKVQPGRAVKVKLNLNPLKKSKVHPRRRSDQGHSERGSPKKGRDQRKKGKDQIVEKKETSGKETKKSSEEESKSESSVKEKKEDEREDGQGDQGNQDENSESAAAAGTPDQSAWSAASGQEHNPSAAPLQYHGAAGSTLTTSQLASQLPRSVSIGDGNQGPNLSLLGPLTSSILPLQGGNFLLNSTTPGLNPTLNPGLNLGLNQGLIPGLNQVLNQGINQGLNQGLSQGLNQGLNQGLSQGLNQGLSQGLNPPLNPGLNPGLDASPAGLVPTSISVGETSLVLSGSSGSVGRPADHTGPVFPNTNSAGGTVNLAISPAPVGSLSNFPESVPGLAPASGPHTSAGPQPMLPAVRILPPPPRLPPTADGSPAAVTTSETLSVSQTRTDAEGHVPPLHGGLATVESGDNAQVTDEPVSGVLAAGTTAQNECSAGDTMAAAAVTGLLQQEYLSEEGHSSPRRKLKLVIPEKTSNRPPTALDRKIR